MTGTPGSERSRTVGKPIVLGIVRERQRAGLDERTRGSIYSAAVGSRVRRADHIEHADVSERVAASDLRKLVEAGLLPAVGDPRRRYYVASELVQALNQRVQEERRPIPDPFAALD